MAKKDEEPFFFFTDSDNKHLIAFEDDIITDAEQYFIDTFEEEGLIPVARYYRNDEDSYFAEIEKTAPEQFKGKKIKCLIIPIRYTKVFKT